MIATNPPPVWIWAYVVFVVGSVTRLMAGIRQRDWALITMQCGFLVINVVGLVRWH